MRRSRTSTTGSFAAGRPPVATPRCSLGTVGPVVPSPSPYIADILHITHTYDTSGLQGRKSASARRGGLQMHLAGIEFRPGAARQLDEQPAGVVDPPRDALAVCPAHGVTGERVAGAV